jgi:hypothetical protein
MTKFKASPSTFCCIHIQPRLTKENQPKVLVDLISVSQLLWVEVPNYWQQMEGGTLDGEAKQLERDVGRCNLYS